MELDLKLELAFDLMRCELMFYEFGNRFRCRIMCFNFEKEFGLSFGFEWIGIKADFFR